MRTEFTRKREMFDMFRRSQQELERVCQIQGLGALDLDALTEPLWTKQLALFSQIMEIPAETADEVVYKLDLIAEWHASDHPDLDSALKSVRSDLAKISRIAGSSVEAAE